MKREDETVKIPALLHLTRLGYGYLPGREARRDRETNILTDRLRDAAERINGVTLAEETFRRMTEDLKALLREEDMGQGFYRTIRDGWNGLKLLDFDNPRANTFLAGTEIACGCGKRRFRPDITLFINGLPLGMMEVKAPEQKGGLKGEYERMCRRFRQESFRPYLQAAQIWMFSNDRESGGLALLPRDGAYYTAGAPEDFPVCPGPEKMPKKPRELRSPNREAERRIREAYGMPASRMRPDPGTPTHRMLTGLAAPERFLFMIRYGIRYVKVPEENGSEGIQKRILSMAQTEALHSAEEKIRRGYRNWHIPCAGENARTVQGAALSALLRDRMPGCEIYWIAEDEDGAATARTAIRRLEPDGDAIRCVSAEEAGKRIAEKAEEAYAGPASERGVRVCILPADGPDYRTERPAAARLRTADRDVLLIVMGAEAPREGGYYTYMLECADGSLYCGWTNNLAERVRTHNAGKGAKYTRSRLPVRLVYFESYGTKQEAMRREWHVKRMRRAEKLALIRKEAEG